MTYRHNKQVPEAACTVLWLCFLFKIYSLGSHALAELCEMYFLLQPAQFPIVPTRCISSERS